MLNEERVILMTRMAAYERREGRHNIKIGNYFRSDYIAVQVLKSLFSVTAAFALVSALYVFYHFETLLQEIYQIDLPAVARRVLLYYVAAAVSYGLLTYVVSAYRYAKAKKSLKLYYHNLKKLNAMYEQQG